MRILRVFPRRTTYTPDDEYVRIGEPDLLPVPEVDEVHVSCLFTWDVDESLRLAEAWHARLPHLPIPDLGGPVFWGDDIGAFTPGLYVKRGVSLSSRGCPNRCPWCLVPEREGKLRLLDICPGYIVNDNNIAAFPAAHFRKLVSMMRAQKRGIEFKGGLEARRLVGRGAWRLDLLRSVKVREMWFAADSDAGLKPLAAIAPKLEGLRRDQKRCYVLAGFDGESVSRAESRLERVFELGFMPFVQLHRGPESPRPGEGVTAEWRTLRRNWSRPVLVLARHAKAKAEG